MKTFTDGTPFSDEEMKEFISIIKMCQPEQGYFTKPICDLISTYFSKNYITAIGFVEHPRGDGRPKMFSSSSSFIRSKKDSDFQWEISFREFITYMTKADIFEKVTIPM